MEFMIVLMKLYILFFCKFVQSRAGITRHQPCKF